MLVVHGNHVKIVAFGIGKTKELGNELALASEGARETKSETNSNNNNNNNKNSNS